MPKTIHRQCNTPTHNSWQSMLERCRATDGRKFDNYSGRGITVCDAWTGEFGFLNFLADMGHRPSLHHTIERNDNDGSYCKANCRWATAREQASNRRNNIAITAYGKTLNSGQWQTETGIDAPVIWQRIKMGWAAERAVSQPIRRCKPRSAHQ